MASTGSSRIASVWLLDSPIALSTTLLLGAAWVDAGVAGFGEVARKVLLCCCGAVCEANVITVVVLVRTSHCSVALARCKLDMSR